MKEAGEMNILPLEADSKVLRWKSRRGHDDRSDSDACANVVPIQEHCLQLMSTLNR